MDSHTTTTPSLSDGLLDLPHLQRLLLAVGSRFSVMLDAAGRVTWASPVTVERLGWTEDESEVSVASRSLSDGFLVPPTGAPEAADLLTRVARAAGSPEPQEWRVQSAQGSLEAARLVVVPLRDTQGQAAGWLLVEASPDPRSGTVLHLANHDSLTGLPTRAVLADRAEMALQRANRHKTVVAVMVIQVLGFEALCAELGRTVGEDVLRATASRLHFELRKTDTAVRLDDEGHFAALLVDLHGPDEALQVANKIQNALSARVNVGVAFIPLTIRIGVAWSPTHGDQLLPLLQAADEACRSTGEPDAPVVAAEAASTAT